MQALLLHDPLEDLARNGSICQRTTSDGYLVSGLGNFPAALRLRLEALVKALPLNRPNHGSIGTSALSARKESSR